MASVEDHLRQWRHNRDFLASIEPAYADWQITLIFYVALQAVDALLVHDKVQGVHSHDIRNQVLKSTNRYQQIWHCYRPLHDMSRKVRYLTNPGFWIPSDQMEANVLKRYLYPIEKSVSKITGSPLGGETVALRKSS